MAPVAQDILVAPPAKVDKDEKVKQTNKQKTNKQKTEQLQIIFFYKKKGKVLKRNPLLPGGQWLQRCSLRKSAPSFTGKTNTGHHWNYDHTNRQKSNKLKTEQNPLISLKTNNRPPLEVRSE